MYEDEHLEMAYEDRNTVRAYEEGQLEDLEYAHRYDNDEECDDGCPATGSEADDHKKCPNCCHEYLFTGPCRPACPDEEI